MPPVKPNKEIIVSELLAEIDFGGSRADCLSINSEKWQLTERTFDRYWKEATERFRDTISRTNEALETVRIEAKKNRLKSLIMDKEERMEVLTKIARGQLTYHKEVATKDGPVEIIAKPDFVDRKAAIAELNKMDGDYAPVKKDITSNGAPIQQVIGIVVE